MRFDKAKSARAIWRFSILVILWLICRWIAVPLLDMPRGAGPTPSAFVPVTATATRFQRLPTHTLTPIPSSTPTPHRTVDPFPLPSANPQLDFCLERKPSADDLLTIVTETYGLSPVYQPADLLPLDSSLTYDSVYGADLRLREVALAPLVDMIHAMQATGLRPIIYSAFRDYATQELAREKWLKENPTHADSLSALPGHSEHQLGLALDFGSPELPELLHDPAIQFHPNFALTHEGAWLAQHAHEYGFSLSYPRAAFATTGFEYEPWHYRYVGAELATYLWETDQFLTKFLLDSRNIAPCMP